MLYTVIFNIKCTNIKSDNPLMPRKASCNQQISFSYLGSTSTLYTKYGDSLHSANIYVDIATIYTFT